MTITLSLWKHKDSDKKINYINSLDRLGDVMVIDMTKRPRDYKKSYELLDFDLFYTKSGKGFERLLIDEWKKKLFQEISETSAQIIVVRNFTNLRKLMKRNVRIDGDLVNVLIGIFEDDTTKDELKIEILRKTEENLLSFLTELDLYTKKKKVFLFETVNINGSPINVFLGKKVDNVQIGW